MDHGAQSHLSNSNDIGSIVSRFEWRNLPIEAQKTRFLELLASFNLGRGSSSLSNWSIDGVEIDPLLLFESVCQSGGFYAVLETQNWHKLARLVVLNPKDLKMETNEQIENIAGHLKSLYWSNLYAFERVLFGQKDDGIDYNLVSVPSATTQGMGELQLTNRSIQPSSSANTKTDGLNHLNGLSVARIKLEEPERLNSPNSAAPPRKRLKLDANSLMELFSSRPDYARPLTWRHNMETPIERVYPPQDFTKSPIPRVSGRLMARQREGLLMRSLEKTLKTETSSATRSGVLSTLLSRSWSKGFYIALYPTLLDTLLQVAQDMARQVNDTALTRTTILNLSPTVESESQLTQLVRISLILRNLAHGTQNLSVLSTHLGVLSVLTGFVSLRHFEPLLLAVSDSMNRTPAELHSIFETWNRYCVGMDQESQFPSPAEAFKLLDSLKSDETRTKISEIQTNALEALCRLVAAVKLSPADPTPATSTLDSKPLSEFSAAASYLRQTIPTLVELSMSSTHPSATIFTSTELLGRFALNPVSRPMWNILSSEEKSKLMEHFVRCAVVGNEMADWSLFAAMHFAINVLDLKVAQILSESVEFIDILIMFCAEYATQPTFGPSDFVQLSSYRRHAFASRSAVILHRLVEFVPMKQYLLKHEDVVIDIYLNAPAEVSNPFYRVFLEMQT